MILLFVLLVTQSAAQEIDATPMMNADLNRCTNIVARDLAQLALGSIELRLAFINIVEPQNRRQRKQKEAGIDAALADIATATEAVNLANTQLNQIETEILTQDPGATLPELNWDRCIDLMGSALSGNSDTRS